MAKMVRRNGGQVSRRRPEGRNSLGAAPWRLAMERVGTVRNILVFRRGLLGDNLVAAPALTCLRQAYPRARIVLVAEIAGDGRCWAREVFEPSGLVDAIIPFAAYDAASRLRKIAAGLKLYRALRPTPWDLGIALDIEAMVSREPWFLRALGAEVILRPRPAGVGGKAPPGTLRPVPNVADQLLEVLRPLGLPLPEPGRGSMQVNITDREVAETEAWLHRVGAAHAPGPWIAVAPWTNMAAKQWPLSRYTAVARQLRKAVGGTHFVLGGPQEQHRSRILVRHWGFGIPAAGSLNVRQGIALLKRCSLYLGNDCGSMHMAVSAGTRCVAIFSGRDQPGLWEPYGAGHVVLRHRVPCEGCMLRECNGHRGRCLEEIGVAEVLEAGLGILKDRRDPQKYADSSF